jgi:hypothetical protein
LFPLLVCAYIFLNLNDACAQACNFIPQSSKTTISYDLLEIKKEMASSMVKKQLSHLKILKMIKTKCKYPLAWWKLHEQ